MMAVFVMAFAISGSVVTMQRAFQSLDSARGITYASQIMQSEMEKMRLLNWATVSAYPTAATTVTIDSSFTSTPYIGNRFTMTRAVATSHSGTMLQITLTITWKSYDGRTLTRSYSTYYGQNGLYDYFSL